MPLDGSEVTQACVSDLLAYSQWCSLSADIIALQFLLNEPPAVVVLKGTISIEPRSEAVGRILEYLHSLSLTTNLTFYLPKKQPLVQCVDELCTGISNNSIRTPPRVSDIPTLYHGAGGIDVNAQLRIFALAGASHRPPAYQDITRTSKPSTTQSKTDSSPAPLKADIRKYNSTDKRSGLLTKLPLLFYQRPLRSADKRGNGRTKNPDLVALPTLASRVSRCAGSSSSY